MADCPQFVIWNPVPAGSKLKAKSASESNDYNSGVRIVGEDGSGTQWVRSDLDPGPQSFSLKAQGYGVRGTITDGPSAPSSTLEIWIEDAGGAKLFDCSWSVSSASAEVRVTVSVVPESEANP